MGPRRNVAQRQPVMSAPKPAISIADFQNFAVCGGFVGRYNKRFGKVKMPLFGLSDFGVRA
jgi:hypothetical protein